MDCFHTISLFPTIFNCQNSLTVRFSTHYTRITWITLRVCKVVQVEKADVGLKRFKISSLRGKNVVINQEKKKCDTARTQGEGSGSLSGKSGRLAENGYTCQGFVPAFGPCRVLQWRLLKKKKEVATGDLKFHFELRIKVPPAGIHFFLFFLFFRRKLCLWNPAVQMNGNKKRNGPHSPT